MVYLIIIVVFLSLLSSSLRLFFRFYPPRYAFSSLLSSPLRLFFRFYPPRYAFSFPFLPPRYAFFFPFISYKFRAKPPLFCLFSFLSPFPVRHFPSFVSAKIGGWEMPLRISLPCGEGRGGVIPSLVWVKGFARSSVRWTVVEQIGVGLFINFFANLFAYVKYFLYLCIVKNINISSIIYIVYNTNVLNSKN